MTTVQATYLGTEDGWHVWGDGSRLPVLFGFDGSDYDADEDEDDETPEPEPDPDAEDDEEIEDPKDVKDFKRARSARQAGKYRVQRNEARQQRDEARMDVAFLKAAGGRFVDLDSALKLADRSLMSVAGDGSVSGADDAVEALLESHPFLVTAAPDDKKRDDTNPFASKPATPRLAGRRTKTDGTYNLAKLRERYPAMRGR